jgi:hypothetical protein
MVMHISFTNHVLVIYRGAGWVSVFWSAFALSVLRRLGVYQHLMFLIVYYILDVKIHKISPLWLISIGTTVETKQHYTNSNLS